MNARVGGVAIKKERYRVHRGEPGKGAVTPLKGGQPVSKDYSLALVDPPSSLVPSVISPSPPPHHIKTAHYRFALLAALNNEISQNLRRKKGEVIKQFLKLYNSGRPLPDIFKELGCVSRPTVYRWIKAYKGDGVDGLVPQYRGPESSGIAPEEEDFLRRKFADGNKPTISDCVRKCKYFLGEMSPSYPEKLRRWLSEDFKRNYDFYVGTRDGQKGLVDKCLPYVERNWRKLSVGEALVGDGCKLNFRVINPFTGKPTRATMVMFSDWKSSYPVGFEIMLTENTQCVLAALRNAIITLGMYPKHVLIDNGKAFRAKIFTRKFQFQETEIPAIFDRLGILPHYAPPYTPQYKPIERLFRTIDEWGQREMVSYVGPSIQDKPPYMNRNEKRALSLHDDWVPTIPEATALIFKCVDYYVDQKLRGRDYLRPRDIFEAKRGPGVNPLELHFFMMACKARMVHQNGIAFLGYNWYHESLYGFKDYVLVYYSYYDLSQVYIFTLQNEFMGIAKPIKSVHPFAADSEFPEDMAEVQRMSAMKRKLKSMTNRLIDMYHSQANLAIDWNRKLGDSPELKEALKQIENKKPKPELVSAFVDGAVYGKEPKIDKAKINSEEEWSELHEHWQRYDYLMERDPETYTEKQRDFLKWYPTTSEYRAVYESKQNQLFSGGSK
jgi:putative transposase